MVPTYQIELARLLFVEWIAISSPLLQITLFLFGFFIV